MSAETETAQKTTVTLELHKGIISLHSAPLGIKVMVHDYDIEGATLDELVTLPDGTEIILYEVI